MASVSESMALLFLDKSPGSSSAEAYTTTLSLGGGEDLGGSEGNKIMGKNRMKVASTDVAVILQAPHVTTSSMWSLHDKLASRMAAMRRHKHEWVGFSCSAVKGMEALQVDAQVILDWYEQHKKGESEAQQDVAVIEPVGRIDVMISNISPSFEPVSLSLADKISNNFPGFDSVSQSMADKVSNKFQGVAVYREEVSRGISNTMGTRKAASNDVAAILRGSDVTPSLMRSVCDKLSSQMLAIHCDNAESKRCSDIVLEGLEPLVVDLQCIMAWYQQQEECDLEAQQVYDLEAQQVSFVPKDDASSRPRNFFAMLYSETLALQCEVDEFKRHTENQKKIEEFLVKIRTIVQQLENDFGLNDQMDMFEHSSTGRHSNGLDKMRNILRPFLFSPFSYKTN